MPGMRADFRLQRPTYFVHFWQSVIREYRAPQPDKTYKILVSLQSVFCLVLLTSQHILQKRRGPAPAEGSRRRAYVQGVGADT